MSTLHAEPDLNYFTYALVKDFTNPSHAEYFTALCEALTASR